MVKAATSSPKLTTSAKSWREPFADLVLAALVGGPLAAPFLAATHWPGLSLIAEIIYWMGNQVCPQPDMGLALWPPHLMAVCMRCYGTLMGLVITRFWVARTQGRGRYWLPQYGRLGLGVAILLCLVYPAELLAQHLGWWGYHNWIVTAFGLVSGLGLGAYIMPLIYGPAKARRV